MQIEFVEEFLRKNDEYLMLNGEEFEEFSTALSQIPDEYQASLSKFPFRNPKTFHILAVFPLTGVLGFDRFLLGDIKKGLLKYFTFGGLGSLWLKDIRSAKKRCYHYNRKKLLEMLNDPSIAEKMSNRQKNLKIGLKAGLEIGKGLAKSGKEFQDSLDVYPHR